MTDVAEAPTTEAPEAPAETNEAEAATKSERRGRPRSQETIDRDNLVYTKISEFEAAPTKEQLVEATGLEGSKVYLSLYRLQRDGYVERKRDGGKHVWVVKAAEAQPADVEA